jgi:hypothetical protein
VQILILEVHHLQASVPHLHPDDDLLQATTDRREISIHTDQEPFPALGPDLVLHDAIERVPDPSLGPDLLRGDEVVEEIAQEGMVEEDAEVLAIAVIAVMMIGAEAEAVVVGEGGDVRGLHACR